MCGVSVGVGVHSPTRVWAHTGMLKDSWHVWKSNRKSLRSTKTEVFKPASVSTEGMCLDKPPDYYKRERHIICEIWLMTQASHLSELSSGIKPDFPQYTLLNSKYIE